MNLWVFKGQALTALRHVGSQSGGIPTTKRFCNLIYFVELTMLHARHIQSQG